jgi:hypothetical protein
MSSYDRLGQLANQHHHEMLADVRQRQLRQQGRSRTLRAPSALTRRLSAAIAKASASFGAPGELSPE